MSLQFSIWLSVFLNRDGFKTVLKCFAGLYINDSHKQNLREVFLFQDFKHYKRVMKQNVKNPITQHMGKTGILFVVSKAIVGGGEKGLFL